MNRDRKESETLEQMIEDFRPGVYEHYKGRQYLALCLAREDETDEVVVVYTRLYARAGLPTSTRRLEVWNEAVQVEGRWVPRFAFCGHVETGLHEEEDDDVEPKPRGLVGWVKDNL